MVKVKINCPICNKFGMIEVEENILKNSKRGIAAVNVTPDLVCEHSFIAYIDRNFTLRDAFVSDFTIELPDIEPKQKVDTSISTELENIDIYLITINIPALTLAYLLKCGFYGIKLLYISNIEMVQNYLFNFYRYIFKDTFNIDLTTMSREDYNISKKKI